MFLSVPLHVRGERSEWRSPPPPRRPALSALRQKALGSTRRGATGFVSGWLRPSGPQDSWQPAGIVGAEEAQRRLYSSADVRHRNSLRERT